MFYLLYHHWSEGGTYRALADNIKAHAFAIGLEGGITCLGFGMRCIIVCENNEGCETSACAPNSKQIDA